jgi:phosphoribosyl 1,2-cyclic phosphate phosphodiesterase
MSGAMTFTFLGTGTSVGVPMLGCGCEVCQSPNPRNHRYRCSVLFGTPEGNILVDTSPELRLQLLRAKVGIVHAVLFTHYHADHMMGLDDVRLFPRMIGGPLPIFCTWDVEDVIRNAFPYAFDTTFDHLPLGAVPRLAFHRIDDEPFEVLGRQVIPIPLRHSRFDVLGFRIGNLAYCTDVSEIPPQSWSLLSNLDVFVIDALRPKPHPAHLSVEEALVAIERVKPKRAFLTHMSHDMDYDRLNPTLPAGVEMAYDGLTLEL